MALSMRSYRLVNRTSGEQVAQDVRRSDGLVSKTIGLMFRGTLGAGEGLWLIPCNGLHTFGMRFSIDVIVLDSSMRVLNIIHALRPFRVVPPTPRAHSLIELAAGGAHGVSIGDRLEVEEN